LLIVEPGYHPQTISPPGEELLDAMDNSPQTINLSFPFTLQDRIRAAFALMSQRMLNIVLAAIWPIGGLSFLAFFLVKAYPLDAGVWAIVACCLLFDPIILVVAVTVTYFSNKYMREPFTYSFDDSGIHVSAVSYEYSHRWAAIARVKKFCGFLMFFYSPGCAHCIPVKHIRSVGAWDSLIAMAKRHGANVDGA
jgi:hypothetical protein